MSAKKILYISFYYPPLGGVASIRALKMTRYLPDNGIQPIVLTVIPSAIRYPKDASLSSELRTDTTVHRAFYPDPGWLFKLMWGLKLHKWVDFICQRMLIAGPERLWLPFARGAINRIMRAHPDISLTVISSGPPAALLLGTYLKKRFQLPYVCEFRDEWTNNPERVNSGYNPRAQHREQELEHRILRECAGCVYLTNTMRDNFIARHPHLARTPSVIIPNGFDPNDFDALQPTSHPGRFTIVYTGSFYDRRQPDALWRALRTLADSGRIDPSQVRVEIIGKNTPAFVLGSNGQDGVIRGMVHFSGFMSHRESLARMMGADVLLLYIPSGENTGSVLTGKIFDYLYSGKPILGIIPPDGMAAELINRAGTGFIADYTDLEGITDRILSLWKLWQQDKLKTVVPDPNAIISFSRQHLAGVLADYVESLMEK